MDINDYLIEQDNLDWGSLLEAWYWKLPENFGLWMVNKLGDVILVFEDKTIHFLDLGAGTLEKIAENQDDFIENLNTDNNADLWLGISLIEDCQAAGMSLNEGQCFGYKMSPALGGDYEVRNLEPTDLHVHYSIHGQIHEQIKDLPDGAKVDIQIDPPK